MLEMKQTQGEVKEADEVQQDIIQFGFYLELLNKSLETMIWNWREKKRLWDWELGWALWLSTTLLMEFWVSWNFVISLESGCFAGIMEPWLLIWLHLSHRNDLLLSYYTWEGPCYQGIYTLDLGCWLWFPRHNDLTGGPSPKQNIANVHDTRINT